MLDIADHHLHSLLMIERLGAYAFCVMFIGVGLLATVWMLLFYRGDSRWLVGPAFVAAGIVGIFAFRALGRAEKRKARTLAEAARGSGTVTAVEKSQRSHGSHTSGFWLTMTVEMPGQAPFQSRVHMSVSHDVLKKVQPGLVLPVRIHPSNPSKVLIGANQWLSPLN
jgi:hypothetical protein